MTAIRDKYETWAQLEKALRKAGLESSSIVVGIDCTKSNTWQGKVTFNDKCLHDCTSGNNPYQCSLSAALHVLAPFDDDGFTPMYGFGDATTGDRSVFSFAQRANAAVPQNTAQALMLYNQVIPSVTLRGPTSFVPLILKAIEIVRQTREYHILLIIGDGGVDDRVTNKKAIAMASRYPISITFVGVGDGDRDNANPWHVMDDFDDNITPDARDIFQFVNYQAEHQGPTRDDADRNLATALMQEVPDQYKQAKSRGAFAQCTAVDPDFDAMYTQTYGHRPAYLEQLSSTPVPSAPPVYPYS